MGDPGDVRMKHGFQPKAGGLLLLLAIALASPVALADPKDEARRHFNAGLELIAAGDYDNGIAEFEAAYALVPHPAVLYNIGRAHADAGNYQAAIDAFEAYLATEPIDRSEVEGYIRVLQDRMAAQQPAPELPSGQPQSAGTVSATPDEIAELRAHAEALAALAESLAEKEERAAAQASGSTPSPSGDTQAGNDPGPNEVGLGELGLGELDGALVEDLYSRQVVTASRFGQDPLEAPAAVTLIDREDIVASGATTIPELLATVPGVDVMQLTAGQADVSARGFNRRLSNKLLILIDGRSVYLDSVGTTLWNALPITMDEIERIEVIRGPGSAIYGANAFAGVVNIITITPGAAGEQSSVRLTAGTKGSYQGSTVLTGRSGDLGYRASAGYTTLGRWAQEIDLENDPAWTSSVDDQTRSLEMMTANGQLDWRLSDGAFASVNAGIADGLVELYSLGALRDFYFDQRSTHVRVDAGTGPLYARVFMNRQTGVTSNWYEAVGQSAPLSTTLDNTSVDSTLTGDFAFGAREQHKLLVGVNYRYKTLAWGFLDTTPTEHHLGGYAQLQSRVDRFVFNGAVRVDRHPLLDAPVASPRLAMNMALGEGRALRVSAGSAFRTPTFIESYANLTLPTGVEGIHAVTVGDLQLEPERIASVEIGLMDEHSDWWRGEAVAFAYQVDNLIDLSGVDSVGFTDQGMDPASGAYIAGQASFTNEAPVYRAAGGELAVDYFGLPGLDLRANYALLLVQQSLDGQTQSVRAAPRHKLNGEVVYRSPLGVDATLGAQWVDKQVWGIRSFDESGQVVITDTDLSGRLIGTARLAWDPVPDLTLSVAAWNWTADLSGPTRQHPLGQPVGSRYTASMAYRF